MAEAKPKPSAPKVFDVSKPGKSAPSTSGKPIIITNRPVLKDPMVVDDKSGDDEDKQLVAPSSSRIKIVPLSHDETETAEPAKEEAKTPDAPTVAELAAKINAKKAAAEVVAPKEAEKEKAPEPEASKVGVTPKKTIEPPEKPAATAAETKPVELKPAEEPTEPEASDKPADEPEDNDDITDDADDSTEPTERDKAKDGTKASEKEVAEQKEKERQAELQKLADSHKYYLPINQIEKRRNKRVAWLGLLLVVVLCLAWADVALDAGLITVPGVKPVTHFFNK